MVIFLHNLYISELAIITGCTVRITFVWILTIVMVWFKTYEKHYETFCLLTLSALCKIFSSLFFQESRIWHFMQIVTNEDILHEMSNLVF